MANLLIDKLRACLFCGRESRIHIRLCSKRGRHKRG